MPRRTLDFSVSPALALIVLLAAAPVAWAQDSSAAANLLRQAASLESRGRYDLAVQTWQRALLADPDQSDALLGLARHAKRRGDLAETNRLIARIRAVAPGRPELGEIESMRSLAGQQERIEEALRLAAAQRYADAMEIYRAVVGPEAPPGGLASSYYETEAATPGGWPRAVRGLRGLVERFPDAAPYKLSLGRLLTYRPETRMEGVALLESVAADPESGAAARSAWRQALLWQGPGAGSIPSLEAYLAGGGDAELAALLAASRSSRPAPADPGGRAVEQGYEALDEGLLSEAETHFQQALRAAPNSAAAASGLGFLRMKQQRFGDAAGYFERALGLSPTDQVVQEALDEARYLSSLTAGSRALEQNRLDEAATAYQQALALRPDSIDAVAALAGTRMRQGRAAEAAPLFERVVAARPDDVTAWKALLRTIHDSDGAAAALERSKTIPEAIALELERDVEHLILMASIYSETGRRAQFDLAFQKVLRNTPNDPDEMAPVRLQFAGLLNRMGRSLEASAEYERTLEADPENLDAWEGLIAALMQDSNGRAMAALARMPRDIYEQALERPAFVFNIGLIHREAGRLPEAQTFLRTALGMGEKLSRDQRIATQLQLAYIDIARESWAEAEKTLRRLCAEYPNEPEVWKGLLTALHEQGRFEEARLESERIPATVITRLYTDPDYVALMASVHNAEGDYAEGLRLVRDAISVYQAERKPTPANLEIQLGWLLLNSGRDPHEQYRTMQRASARDDLSDEQRARLDELWTVWSLREASAAAKDRDFERATSILAAALRLYPDDTRLYAALAGAFLDAGDHAQALFVYQNWGLRNGAPEDFSGAIGAAMAMKQNRLVSRWLRQGLEQWPRDMKLLTLAGGEAASRGDYDRAEQYWRLALEAAPAESGAGADALDEPAETSELGRLLVAGVIDPSLDEPYVPLPPRGRGLAEISRYAAARASVSSSLSEALDPRQRRSEPRRRLEPPAESRRTAPVQLGGPAGPGWTPPAEVAALAFEPRAAAIRRPERSQREELEDRLAALEARNSPFAGVQPILRGRSGREGFETLSEQQLSFDSALAVGNKLRLALAVRPTHLDAGSPDGNSELRLGLAPSASTIGAGTASGIGAEAQLSSENFGLRVGSTPDGFLVRNLTLGLRVRPAHGPFTLVFDRDVVKDTLLSYAGVRDPISGQVFGGVMANALSLEGDWGGASSGVFLRGGYQHLSGESVETNRRIDGGGGAWWRVLETPDGALTIGANLFAMKYDKNLRYFTLGHGGYFSPQRYILFNMPASWRGTYQQRFEYAIGGSLGIQHIAEDDAPYFPRDAALQGARGPFYLGLEQTGEHFTLELEGAYRVAPRWSLGGFAAVNNTRNFTDQRAGIFMRYMFQPQPLTPEMAPPALPDWRGSRRIGLP